MRVFLSKNPDGPFYDAAGNPAVLGTSTNLDNIGLKVMGNYKFSSLDTAYMACGHNSVLRDVEFLIILQIYLIKNHLTWKMEIQLTVLTFSSGLKPVEVSRNKVYSGNIRIGGMELSEILEESLMQNITYISHNSYLFKGTVRDNLQMGNLGADDAVLWDVLEQTKLADFLRSEQELDTQLTEAGGNFSGGQRQRLALARAILHDSPIYIFDEATSNIDMESENDIMEQIRDLARTKTVLLISHRLANAVDADRIYVLEQGSVAESGTHEELLYNSGTYAKLWNVQQELETVGKRGK